MEQRRTFAIISHPDAGKTTLTEKCLLYAGAVGEAGVVRGRAGTRGATSDFHAMERERGISIASTVLQFGYRGATVNLLDTPGHADFSEDTYRVLAAADFAVMVLDAAKGLEPQTLKLFDVCRHRDLPVMVFVNKYDRPGREPLELLDEVEQRIGLIAAPVTWPVGIAGDLRGLVDRRTGLVTRYGKAAHGARQVDEVVVAPDVVAAEDGSAWETAQDELELLESLGDAAAPPTELRIGTAPVFFGSALSNVGVRTLLDAVLDIAPGPVPRSLVDGRLRPLDDEFSGLVFKVAGSTNRMHRDTTAYLRVCSGTFSRGMPLVHGRTGRSLTTKYAHTAFAAERTTVEEALPGDVVGLVNATGVKVGDTLYAGRAAEFPPLPVFAPEHFRVASCADTSRAKQFRRGISQLDDEGVVQVLRSERRGDASPVLGAVGPMQFEVAARRLADEYGVTVQLDSLPYEVAMGTDEAGVALLAGQSGAEVVRREDGRPVALVTDSWRVTWLRRQIPALMLEPFVGAT